MAKLTLMVVFFAGKGSTVPSKSVDAKKQVENQHTGTSDHLELGMRKET